MTIDTKRLIARARDAAKRADWYMTGESPLLRALVDALEAAEKRAEENRKEIDRLSRELQVAEDQANTIAGDLAQAERERDNWKMSAEEATRAEKRWKDRAVEAERENRQHRKDLAEWEKVHAPAWIDARDRQIAEARAQRNQLAAVIEKVRVRLTTDLDVNDESHVSDALDILATSPSRRAPRAEGRRLGRREPCGKAHAPDRPAAAPGEPLPHTRGAGMSTTDEFESLADWMGEQDWTVNVRDYTDEYVTYVRGQPVELLAERLMQSSWLAEHEAKVRAEAMQEAAAIVAARRPTGLAVLTRPGMRSRDAILWEAQSAVQRRAREIEKEAGQ